jgi:urea transport system ATP-binding protein
MLDVIDVNQQYGQSQTLWDLSLELPDQGCLCLMGRNGVGKTTLLNCLMGLVPIHSGTIRFAGEDITRFSTEARARLGMGYVPQGRMIFPLLTVEENLRLALPARRARTGTVPDLIYDLFPVLADMRQRRGGDLSGGQQQQLAIGRALVLEPKLLILDEPCEGIQPNVITRLNHDLGIAILLVEQKLPFARRVADHFSIMDKGRVVAEGEMMRLDDALIAEYLTV